jgi:hypothetical protein
VRISLMAITCSAASRSPVSVITIGAKRRSGLDSSISRFSPGSSWKDPLARACGNG